MKKFIPIIIFVVLLGAIITIIAVSENKPSKYDGLAQCINKSGTTFYGAFWCPHCKATKALFGTAAQYLPYHECSTPDGKGELQECIDAGVKGYPTWVFPDGTRITGEQTLESLAEKTNCPLPQ